MAGDLWERIDAGDLPAEEVVQLLFERFGEARSPSRGITVLGPESAPAVVVRYGHGLIVEISAGSGLRETDVRQLAEVMRAERAAEGDDVMRRVAFCEVPVPGAHRFGDQFQILPVPDHAPRPQFLLDAHPFLIEFRVRRGADPHRQLLRAVGVQRRLHDLLGGLLRFRIDARPPAARWAWVRAADLDPSADPNTVVHAQEWYSFDGMTGIDADFSPIDDLAPLPMVPESAHVVRFGRGLRDELSVPVGTNELVSIVADLDQAARVLCHRACHWLQHASAVSRMSTSAAFVALVLAIETLAGHAGGTPGKRFDAFLALHSPTIDPEARSALYRARNALLHGGKLFPSDLYYAAPALDADAFDEYDLFASARAGAQLGLASWLRTKAA